MDLASATSAQGLPASAPPLDRTGRPGGGQPPLVKAERLALLGSKFSSRRSTGPAVAAHTELAPSSPNRAPSPTSWAAPAGSTAPMAPTWSSPHLSEEEVPF